MRKSNYLITNWNKSSLQSSDKNRESQTKAFLEVSTETQELTFPDLDAKYHDSIRKMLASFADMWGEKLYRIDNVEHRVEMTQDNRPFHFAPYPVGPKTRKLEKLEIQNQLRAGVIEQTTSEWASQMLFVSKKDVSLRFGMHYRRLSEAMNKDTYSLPSIDECSDSLGAAKSSAFWVPTTVIGHLL